MATSAKSGNPKSSNSFVLESRLESKAGFSDTIVVAAFQESGKDAKKKLILPKVKAIYRAPIERFCKSNKQVFSGRNGTVQFLRMGAGKGKKAQNILLVGLGSAAELTEEKMRMAAGNAYTKLKSEKCEDIQVLCESLVPEKGQSKDLSDLKLVRAFAEGFVLSAYEFKKYKSQNNDSEKEYNGIVSIVFASSDKTLVQNLSDEVKLIRSMGDVINIVRDWSNEPSNMGTPEYFASEAEKLARQFGLKCRILEEKDAQREKMGLFLGVGQGSEREGKIVILEYAPKSQKDSKTIALVGKGITFDSGGISIKPALRMEEMKHDMTGAATVLGAILLASQMKAQNHIVAIMAFTENMPDGSAIQPGNVLTARSGKTVEIINTDAEGRLILADALDFAHEFKPDAIIDVATLTGAVSIALGKICCGILGNNQALIDSVKRAGEATGERIWQLPLFDEYFEDMKSETADLKNSVNDSYGGTIRGAIFLKQFIKKGVSWAHLDIAATSFNAGVHLSYLPKKGANGIYVRTLARFAADY